jgi:membrane protease YdiL (CAAX protease family)
MFKKKEEEDPTQLNLSYKILLLFLICLSASWNITAILFPDLGINPGSILGAFAIPLGVLIFVYKVPLKKLGFTGGNSRNILGSIIISVVYGVLVFIVMGFINLQDSIAFLSDIGYTGAETLSLLPLTVLVSILIFTIVASIPEEFLFRTVIQTTLTERHGSMLAILITSFVFGMFHIPVHLAMYLSFSISFEFALVQSIIISFLFAGQVSILFGIAWERTRSLMLPICLHTAHNVAELLPWVLFIMLGILV